MQVNFTFDKAAVERRGHALEDVHQTVKSLFAAHDLPCVSDGDILSFKDKGHGDDFACMWDIILSLLHSDWFMECASSCVWQDEDGEEVILSNIIRNPSSRISCIIRAAIIIRVTLRNQFKYWFLKRITRIIYLHVILVSWCRFVPNNT